MKTEHTRQAEKVWQEWNEFIQKVEHALGRTVTDEEKVQYTQMIASQPKSFSDYKADLLRVITNPRSIKHFVVGDILLFTQRVENPYRRQDNKDVELVFHRRAHAFRTLNDTGSLPPEVVEVWYAPYSGPAARLSPSTLKYGLGHLTAEIATETPKTEQNAKETSNCHEN